MLLAGVIRESFVEGSTPELSLEGPACAKISTGRETRKGGAKDVTEKHQENSPSRDAEAGTRMRSQRTGGSSAG